VAELYSQGLKLVTQELELAQQLFAEVESTRLPLSLICYNDTVDNSFKDFFDNYEARFDAHNTPTSIDYPLLSDDMSWTGIIYIKQYLEHLKLENEICAYFPLNNITTLIAGAGHKNGFSGTEFLVNIPELVLKNSVCSVLIGKKADDLEISEDECKILETRLKRLTEQQFPELLSSALNEVFGQFNLTKPVLLQYSKAFLETFCPQFMNAVKENALSGLIVLAKDISTSSSISYEPGQKLNDEELRLVISELKECPDGAAKADLIEAEIHNIEDLIDVFGAFCIFDEEYSVIFSRMDDYQLAILASTIVDNSPLSAERGLTLEPWYKPEYEIYWQEKLINYLEVGDSRRFEMIMDLAGELRKQTSGTKHEF
jgi:hypothetical protein